MKIAFVGKGGSGKSTMTSLFIRYLQAKAERDVLAIDADHLVGGAVGARGAAHFQHGEHLAADVLIAEGLELRLGVEQDADDGAHARVLDRPAVALSRLRTHVQHCRPFRRRSL